MQAYAEPAVPGARGSITRTRAVGAEAPLRRAIADGERLLVCASVRFPDQTSSQPLWLTDRRFLLARKQKRAKFLVSIPIKGSTWTYDAGEYPLHLQWTDEAGRPRLETFRVSTWKDSIGGIDVSAGSGGVSAGIVGALIGLALDAGISALVGKRESASRDEALYSTLTAAVRTPADVRPVDLTAGSPSTLGSRLFATIPFLVLSSLLVACVIWGLLGFELKQAYEKAPPCGTPPTGDCRVLKPAVVTDFRGESGKYSYCYLWLRLGDGSRAEAQLHNDALCAAHSLGQAMSIEYFRGTLTGVIRVGTGPADADEESDDNPEYSWRFGGIVALVCAVFWALITVVASVSVVSWVRRRSLLQRSAQLGGYLM